MDADQSGSLSYDEFRNGLKDFGMELQDSEVASLLKMLDANGDGELSLQEFSAIVKGELEMADLQELWSEESVAVSSDVKDAAIKATNAGTRFTRTNSVFGDLKRQGCAEMMTQEAISQRAAMKEDPRIHGLMQGWWTATRALSEEIIIPGQIEDASGVESLSKSQYMTLSIPLHEMYVSLFFYFEADVH